MADEEIIIVDEHDNVIGYKKRSEVDIATSIFRVSALWVKNSKGEHLLAQRGLHKEHNPGKWGPAVTGTVDKGETYDENIKKETFEEIGIKNVRFRKGPKLFKDAKYTHFTQWYTAAIDKPAEEFVLEDQVEQVKWFSTEELKELIKQRPHDFLTSVSACLDRFATKVFFIHGAYGNGTENWFGWLKDKLESEGYEVIVPVFPTPKDQTLENWRKIFSSYEHLVDEHTIFVGHSLGPSFILDILERVTARVKACFFVAGFCDLLGHEIDEINRSFVDRDFNWENIKKNCEQFYVINSDNDPYVDVMLGKELACNVGVEMTLREGKGHFNKAADMTEFDELLDLIKLSVVQNEMLVTNSLGYKLSVFGCEVSKKKDEAIILVHGFGSSKREHGNFDSIAYSFVNKGHNVFRFDFSGLGGSEGKHEETTLNSMQDDFTCVFDFVKEKYSKVHIISFSLGNCVALACAREFASLTLIAAPIDPAKDLVKFFGDGYRKDDVSIRTSSSGKVVRMKPEFFNSFSSFDFLSAIEKVNCPVAIIHGSADKHVSFEDGKVYYAHAKEPKKIYLMGGATHYLGKHMDDLLMCLFDWFSSFDEVKK